MARRCPPPMCCIGGGDGAHDWHRRANRLVQCRAKSPRLAGPADLGDGRRGVSMAATVRHRTMGLIAAAGIGLLSLLGTVPAQEQDCTVPAHFYDTEPTLPKTASAIA